jgi:peptide subunit release factor 1 (eRF1)
MLTDRDIRELLNYSSTEPMLSVYLNTSPSEGGSDAQKLQLRKLLEEVNLPEDQAAVLKYFEQLRDARGRGLAMFSSASEGYFRGYPLAVPVRSRVFVGDHPYVKLLADLLDNYGSYGVVLVDKQGARLFHFHLGELVEQEGILGDDVRQTHGKSSSSNPGGRGGVSGQSRFNDEVTARNLREAAEFSASFFDEVHARRILIGGTDETIAQFRQYLPKAWHSLVVGTFPMSMTASHTEVLARAMQIGQQAEQQRDNALVESMLTAAAKGQDGAVGLEATLEAVHGGRVQTLIVQEGLRLPAYQCQGCEHLLVRSIDACLFCGKSFARIDDAVELAVRRVMQTGGEVEIVRDNPALQEVGIGALLRY